MNDFRSLSVGDLQDLHQLLAEIDEVGGSIARCSSACGHSDRAWATRLLDKVEEATKLRLVLTKRFARTNENRRVAQLTQTGKVVLGSLRAVVNDTIKVLGAGVEPLPAVRVGGTSTAIAAF